MALHLDKIFSLIAAQAYKKTPKPMLVALVIIFRILFAQIG
jgi:hypothetical protein